MAMQRVQMCNAIKVMCVFSKPFWPQDFFDIICTGSLL
jgi:monoamine oxidase